MTLLLKYLILLTVGVFANVAVVWSSAILVDPAQSERTIIDSSYSDGRYSL